MKIKEHDSEVSCAKFVSYLGNSGNYVEFLKNIKINSMMSILAKYKSREFEFFNKYENDSLIIDSHSSANDFSDSD